MKCNWCGKGSGNTYLKDIKMNKVFYYYCSDCIGNIEKELNPKLPEPIMDIKYIFPQKTKMDFSNKKLPEPQSTQQWCDDRYVLWCNTTIYPDTCMTVAEILERVRGATRKELIAEFIDDLNEISGLPFPLKTKWEAMLK